MTRILMTLVALALALPSAAAAQQPQTNAPPGNSGIDEYLETVPGAGGDRRTTRPGDGGEGGGGGALTRAQRERLERLGPDGRALAGVVDATSPGGSGQGGARRGDGRAEGSTRETPPPIADGQSPLRQALDAASGQDDGGLGLLLPGILTASLLAVVTLILLRRRSAS